MMRTCRICHLEKDIEEFVRHSRKGNGGYEKLCKVCNRQRRADDRAGVGPGTPLITDPMSDAWDAHPINLEKVSRKLMCREFDRDTPPHQAARIARVFYLIDIRPASYLARIASEVYGVEL